MSATQVLGAILCALPFLGLAALTFYEGGWRCFAFTFGLTGAIVAVVAAGSYLLTGGAR